ncbi:MAG: arginine--tRNA ligase [Bacteroidales bacterium]|nr:arginine--tRNA ligase [Bacteroidales bacterium]
MTIDALIEQEIISAVQELYGATVDSKSVQISDTKKEIAGDKTVVIFPLVRISKKSPEETANELGKYLVSHIDVIDSYSVIKGFLNLTISMKYWLSVLQNALQQGLEYGKKPVTADSPTVMVEFSSPNTNKPLHLGHVRNNLLGYSISQILAANGNKVIKANLVNDRGIHICKSMIAWKLFGNGETPQSSGLKGDHLVGNYYVVFDKEYKKQVAELMAAGKSEDEAKAEAPILLQAREMLVKWEQGDPEVLSLWKTMNGWVYEGFDATYKRMGVSFDHVYYESQTYLLGKKVVMDGLQRGILFQKEDKSVWADLTDDGLDQKLLLRPDGTSVYMTQDIGTAIERFREYGDMGELIYVVGNEQNYHFQVLSLILQKLGYDWAKKIYHMSYGMVELPDGKMKSREGTVVDADDLMDSMVKEAKAISDELGKLSDLSDEDAAEVHEIIAQGALKYFMLKVEPRKTMLFNPKESIDFNGNTGPFIQYTHARICSLLRKAAAQGVEVPSSFALESCNDKEKELIKTISRYGSIIELAAKDHAPSYIANYVYDLVKMYNQFYHDYSILNEEDAAVKTFRLALSKEVATIVASGMGLLGIRVPERM